MASSEPRRVTLTNSGTADLVVTGITVTGDFTQTNDYGAGPLAPGDSCSIDVVFTPTVTGTRTGQLRIASNAPGSPHTVPLSGSGVPAVLPRLSVLGNQFVTPTGETVRLKSVNWFGAEGTNHTPHGTWLKSYTSIVDQIASMGFNCIRMPFSGDTFKSGSSIPPTAVDWDLNPAFVGKTPIQVMDIIIAYIKSKGLYVVLDHHRRAAGNGADGGPTDGSYSQSQWIATWTMLAERYKDDTCVVGADVHNEPHNLDWNTWATMVEACGNAILAVAPNWIIFCEGVGHIGDDHYWWGGQLAGVRTRPVVLSAANRLAYSPHEYGQSVGSQQWLATDSNTPAGWPGNLYPVWESHWGFIFEENIAPIWIGEFGGHYGLDGTGGLTKPHRVPETTWTTELVKYLNGDFDGNGTRDLEGTKKGMSFAYWSFNPNSGDTGGLVQDDWVTPQTPKLNLIAPLLT